jgi:spermidine/putrescine-binding protein
MGFLCGLCINANAKNVDLAYAYIDAMLAPQALADMANMYGYGVSNADAIPLIDPAMAKLLELDDPDIINRTNFQKSLTTEQIEEYGQMWSEVKAAP